MIMNKNIKYWLKEKASKNLFNVSKTYAIFNLYVSSDEKYGSLIKYMQKIPNLFEFF